MAHSRRSFLRASAIVAAGVAVGGSAISFFSASAAKTKAAQKFEITKSDKQWKAVLTPAQFYVLRRAGTERPYSSRLNSEKRKGVFRCAGCNLPLYVSSTKYDSRTGWPSFWKPLPKAVKTTTDYKLGYPRTEVHCRRCGGHLGHIFSDGPRPTGKRHCINGVALKFRPTKS